MHHTSRKPLGICYHTHDIEDDQLIDFYFIIVSDPPPELVLLPRVATRPLVKTPGLCDSACDYILSTILDRQSLLKLQPTPVRTSSSLAKPFPALNSVAQYGNQSEGPLLSKGGIPLPVVEYLGFEGLGLRIVLGHLGLALVFRGVSGQQERIAYVQVVVCWTILTSHGWISRWRRCGGQQLQ